MNTVIAWITTFVMIFSYIPGYFSARQATDVDYPQTEAGEIRVMSSNVRYFNIFTDIGEQSWLNRAGLLVKGIQNYAPGVIGFQEATKLQYNYLKDVLYQYDSVIKYRDFLPNSEGCPVFYRTDLYNLVDEGSFWLSETPDRMSRDWDAGSYRICTYVILQDKATEKKFVVFNTHLDNASEVARVNGIALVLEKIKEFGSLPAMLMGDFNAEEGTVTYLSATENFDDVKYRTEDTMTSCTYQAFGKHLDYDCIDYIMISKQGFEVKQYKVITDTYDGVYSSDHFPIFTVLELV